MKSILFATLFLACLVIQADSSRPNFVIIIGDDISWDHFGCTGSKYVKTPNIDKLSSQSLHIDRFYSTVAQCGPLRSELYTGLYPWNNGNIGNSINLRKKEKIKKLQTYLNSAGYEVGISGKTHSASGIKKIKGLTPNCNHSGKAKFSLDGTKEFIDSALKENKNFCVILAAVNAHHPWESGSTKNISESSVVLPPHYVDTPKTREVMVKHAAEVEDFDSQVGMAMKMLDEMKLSQNTGLIFLSEQGIAMPRAKWTAYDHGARALCLVRWPGKIKAQKSDAIAQYCDILPTLIDLSGNKIPPLDGKSMKKLLLGEVDEHREYAYVASYDPCYQLAVVKKDYKLIWNQEKKGVYVHKNFKSPKKLFSKPWKEWTDLSAENAEAKAKLDRIAAPPEFELYKISEDPYELNNLAENPEYKTKIEELKKLILSHLKLIGEPLEKQYKKKEL